MMYRETPKDRGFEDYHQGALRISCPYPPRTKQEEEWLKGYDAAATGRLSLNDKFN